MSISPMFLVEKHKILPLVNNKSKKQRYCILGNLPSSLDSVSAKEYLPVINKGDKLAVLNTGAYFVSFNNNFAGPKPPIVLIDRSSHKIIRSREDFERIADNDIF